MYTGPDSEPYKAIHSPWPVFVKELKKRGKLQEAKRIEEVLKQFGWKL